ncbi:gamma-aminobutyric acid type B receptor subunit 2-like [Clytia hemisphaerica]|uniref:G-protein coupled receptors family 3 profile domain-containing protein n=1 Tax=Clytia hemisphaerica TaxID=252671 RepID=A0A7M5XG93_9CNID
MKYIYTAICLAVYFNISIIEAQRPYFNKTKKLIEIAAFLPSPNEDNHCIRAAIQMSIDDINENSKIFFKNETYRFTPSFYYMPRDTTSAMLLISKIVDFPLNDAPLMLLGSPYGYDQNQLITDMCEGRRQEAIPVFSFSGKGLTTELTYRMELSPAIYTMMLASVNLLMHYNWTRVGIIHDFSTNEYRELRLQPLLDLLQDPGNVTVASQIIIEQTGSSEKGLSANFDEFEKHFPRIIIGFFEIKGARLVFCQAYKRHMKYPMIVWILYEILPDGWAGSQYDPPEGREISCTEEELLSAAFGYISVTKSSMLEGRTDSVLNTLDTYLHNLTDTPVKSNKCPPDTLYAHDAVQLTASMYNEYLSRRHSTFSTIVKYAKQYESTHMKNTTTGEILFKSFFGLQRMSGFIDIHKNVGRNVDKQYIGTYTIENDQLELVANSTDVLFGSYGVPRDAPLIKHEHQSFKASILWTMWGLAIAGCIFTIIIFVINLIHLIRYESDLKTPIIDHFILFGALLCYGSIFIYGLDTEFISLVNVPDICMSFSIVLAVGFSFLVGGLLVKMWQMYKLSIEKDDEDKELEDRILPEWKLILLIVVIFIGDAIILVTWFVRSSFYTRLYDVTSEENNKAIHTTSTILKTHLVRCECDNQNIYVITLYVYKGVLLLMGTFIFWQIRNSTLPILSHSKDIGMAICNVFLVSTVAVVCSSILVETEEYDSVYIIVAICIVITVTMTLILVFALKINGVIFGGSAGLSSSVSKFAKKSIKKNGTKRNTRNMTSSTPAAKY